jgi:hypothetical protein
LQGVHRAREHLKGKDDEGDAEQGGQGIQRELDGIFFLHEAQKAPAGSVPRFF